MKTVYLILIPALFLGACTTKHGVIAHTGTVVGLDLSEDPASGLYHVKFGYARSELAYVPSNRSSGATNDPTFGGGAKDVASVIMELKMQNIFSGGGIYQRLAVGDAAVTQPGAVFMFAKDADGTLPSASAAAVTQALAGIPSPDATATTAKLPLAAAYKASDQKTAFDTVARAKGYASFADFLSKPVSLADVQAVASALGGLINKQP